MLDIIGKIYKTTQLEGQEDPVVQELEGFHVNSPFPLECFSEFEVNPNTPTRVFGGHPTHFYSFESEAQFKELAIANSLMQPDIQIEQPIEVTEEIPEVPTETIVEVSVEEVSE